MRCRSPRRWSPGGLPVLEVTLRTTAALDAIRAMRAVPGAIVGAGTVLSPSQLAPRRRRGRAFAVSPGLTEPLGEAATERDLPLLPGVATASEIMRALDLGFTRLKFFPAEASGGLPALKALERRVRRRPLLPDRRNHPGQCPGLARPSRRSPASAAAGSCRPANASIRRRLPPAPGPPPRSARLKIGSLVEQPVAYDTGFR